MRRAGLLAAVLALVLGGCDEGAKEAAPKAPTASGAVSRVTPGEYEAGVDILPGVYTADVDCRAITSATAGLDLAEENSDPDSLRAIASLVRDVRRIEVHRGEFLTVSSCSWKREDAAGPRSPDPSTLAGGCEILLGDGLAEQVLAFLRKQSEAAQNVNVAGQIQERLMAVVFVRTKRLWSPAGEMVDFLDAPDAFVDAEGRPEARVTQAMTDIRKACRGVYID